MILKIHSVYISVQISTHTCSEVNPFIYLLGLDLTKCPHVVLSKRSAFKDDFQCSSNLENMLD